MRTAASERMTLIKGEREVDHIKRGLLAEWHLSDRAKALLPYVQEGLEERLAEALGEILVLRERVEDADGKAAGLEKEAKDLEQEVEVYATGEEEALTGLHVVCAGLVQDLESDTSGDGETVETRLSDAQHADKGRAAERLVNLIDGIVKYYRARVEVLEHQVDTLEDEVEALRDVPPHAETKPPAARPKRQPIGTTTIPLPFPSTTAATK